MNPTPKEEAYYMWKEFASVEGEPPRLLTPWADPQVYEYPFDFMFKTKAEAKRVKKEWGAEDEDWVLCLVTTKPLTPAQMKRGTSRVPLS